MKRKRSSANIPTDSFDTTISTLTERGRKPASHLTVAVIILTLSTPTEPILRFYLRQSVEQTICFEAGF